MADLPENLPITVHAHEVHVGILYLSGGADKHHSSIGRRLGRHDLVAGRAEMDHAVDEFSICLRMKHDDMAAGCFA